MHGGRVALTGPPGSEPTGKCPGFAGPCGPLPAGAAPAALEASRAPFGEWFVRIAVCEDRVLWAEGFVRR